VDVPLEDQTRECLIALVEAMDKQAKDDEKQGAEIMALRWCMQSVVEVFAKRIVELTQTLKLDEKRRALLEELAKNCAKQWNPSSAKVLAKLQERESQILGAILLTSQEKES